MIQSEVRFYSRHLGMRVSMNVLLPEAGDGPFATLYLLHGLSDDHSIWNRLTRLEMFAWRLPMAIVMPQGFRGFYTTNNAGPDYARYINEDVVGEAERLFPLRRERAGRAIGGLSMGGYGALRVGLGWPDRFASIVSHSGAVMYGTTGQRTEGPMSQQEYERIFGASPEGTDHDLVTLARRAGTNLPAIAIDCGGDDFLLDQNRALHQRFDALKIPHAYEEFPGEHNWQYWDARLPEALARHAEAMGVEPLT
jgi:S-formylglutathione hydrolase FrmB